MTLLELFTAGCGVVWLVTSLIESVRAGVTFDAGPSIDSHYKAAMAVLPFGLVILTDAYLLWFHGFVPRPVEHTDFELAVIAYGAFLALPLIGALFHFLAWIRLEAKGMEFGLGPAGPAAGLFRVSKRSSPGNALLDPLPRARRESLEVAVAIVRRKNTILSTLALLASALGTFFGYAYEPWLGWVIGICAFGPSLAWWMRSLFENFVYRLGAQFIPGAKVLEAPLRLPADEKTAKPDTHGNARLATESEVQAAASGNVKKSSVHDRDY